MILTIERRPAMIRLIRTLRSAAISSLVAAAACGAISSAASAQPAPPAFGPAVRVALPPASTPGASEQPASDDASALTAKLQNPIGGLISVPFQNNTNFNVGPHKGTQDILNIQPVIPIHLNRDWNLITRTILPLVWSPSFQPAPSVPFGLAPTTLSAFHHCQLASRRRNLDAASRHSGWASDQDRWQTAGKFGYRRRLQRTVTAIRRKLAASDSDRDRFLAFRLSDSTAGIDLDLDQGSAGSPTLLTALIYAT
ncbi:MAG TPA: hypothetical protein VLI93_05900 [Acetobacteraceae bacterium]|nr:hypothetical protein [Acetobacteraceae bacterium]